MPTNDERREVAARLREQAEEVIYESDPYGLLAAVAFLEKPGRYIRDGEIFNRLADLIEPEPERTCEIEFNFPQEVGFKQIDCRCSECWHGMSVHDRYCAECGARVTE